MTGPILSSIIVFVYVCGSVSTTNVSTTHDAVISATPSSYYPGLTRTMTINCSFLTGPGSDFDDVMSVIVSRKTSTDQLAFKELASLTSHDADQVQVKDTSTGADITGHLNQTGLAYLCLKWTYPDSSVQGEYKCEAFGMDHAGHPRVSQSTTEVVAEEDLTTSVLLRELKQMQTHQAQLEQMMTSRLNQTMAAFIATSASFRGHRYLLSKPTLRDITKSDSLCRLFGGYLVEIDDKAEYDFVWNFAIVDHNIDYLTLGATDMDKEGDWRFLYSKRPVVFQKHGDGLTGGAGNNCMEIWKEYNGYVDEPCFGPNNRKHVEGNFLCEVDH